MRAVDLFCGCGGLSLGLGLAGIRVDAAFDSWDAALAVYQANIQGHPAEKFDLSDWEGASARILSVAGRPDIIAGGPPCQDFSSSGLRSEGMRANLTRAFAKTVTSIAPRYFIMENVARAQKSAAYADAKAIFKDSGYGLTERVLDASYCGAPQARKRFFCIGAKDAPDGFLNAEIDASLAATPMTIRQYFEDAGIKIEFENYYRHPRNYDRRGVFSIDEPAPTMRGVNRPIPPGYRRHAGDAADPAGGEVKALTAQQRATIQTFPADFRWIGARTKVEQMIGNAVPVQLGRFVATCLKRYDQTIAAQEFLKAS